MDAINHFANLGPRLGFSADLVKDQTLSAGIVQLVKETGRNMDRLVLLEDKVFVLLEAFHSTFPLDHKKGVIGAGMAMQLVIDSRFVAVQGYVTPIRMRRTDVVSPGRLSPLGLLSRVDNRYFTDFLH
jgi:hypothetical protein